MDRRVLQFIECW